MWLWWALCSGTMWQSVWCSNIVNIPHPFHIKPHLEPHKPFHITKAHDTPHLACCSLHHIPLHHLTTSHQHILHMIIQVMWLCPRIVHHISFHTTPHSTSCTIPYQMTHAPFPIKWHITPHLIMCNRWWCDVAKHDLYCVTWRDVELCCCGVVQCGNEWLCCVICGGVLCQSMAW